MELFQGPMVVSDYRENDIVKSFGTYKINVEPIQAKPRRALVVVKIDPLIYALTKGESGYTYVTEYI